MGTFLEELHIQAEAKIQNASERTYSSMEYKLRKVLMDAGCFHPDDLKGVMAEIKKLEPVVAAKVRRDCMTSLFENLGLMP